MNEADEKHLYNKGDPSSYANAAEAISTNIELDWDIDFDAQTIRGSVQHTVKIVTEGASHVDFDSSKINMSGDVLVNGNPGTFVTAPTNKVLGTKISVFIPQDLRAEGTTFTVKFFYHITTEASATQWLAASATKGQKHPYLFTQCQAIHARSLMPCQDSPGIKATYTARITAPTWCTVLMSAIAEPTTEEVKDKNVFLWKQPSPVSAYLIALAAGHMESREISHRVRVWAEPEVVEAALFEFSETEEFVQAAEELTGCPYQWGRYDILCLPPSFPYGGMENPCLTFATPTLLAGDKSLADVIAHEIAHSWTGNLVTNHNWDHFWLNEGWTVWLERKITSKVRNNPEFGRLSSQIGWKHLADDVKLHGESNPVTALVWRLGESEDPDDYYSSVPYEKGCNLLLYLEEVVGTELFDKFVASYIDKFKFGTVTTGEFRDNFVGFIEARAAIDASRQTSDGAVEATPKKGKNAKKNKGGANNANNGQKAKDTTPTPAMVAAEAVKRLDWQQLFYSPGMPTDVTSFNNSLSKAAEDLAMKWITHAATYKTDAPPAGITTDDVKDWPTMQKNVFLETLQNFSRKSLSHPSDVFPVPFLELLDRTYAFGESKNAEIMLRWQTLCLESEAQWIVPSVVEFITTQGRMKFVRPLYRLLRDTAIGKQVAIETFEKNKDIYHPIARKMIAADLKRKADAEAEAIDEQRHAESEHESPSKLPPPLDQTASEDENLSDMNLAPPAHGTPEITPLKSTSTTSRDVTPQHISSPERFFTPTESAAPTPAKESQQSHATSNGSKTTAVNIPEDIVEVPSVESTPTKAPTQTAAAINPLVAANGPTEQPEDAPNKPTGPATSSAPTPAKVAAETPAPVTNNTPDNVAGHSSAHAKAPASADAPLPASAPVPSPAIATPASAPATASAGSKDTQPAAPQPAPVAAAAPAAAPAAAAASVDTKPAPAPVQTKESPKPAVTQPAATPSPVPAAAVAPVRTPSPAPNKPTTVTTNTHWSVQNILMTVFGVAVGGGFVAYWFTTLRHRNTWK